MSDWFCSPNLMNKFSFWRMVMRSLGYLLCSQVCEGGNKLHVCLGVRNIHSIIEGMPESRAVHLISCVKYYTVQFSRSVTSNSLRPHALQHARPLCPSPTPRVYSHLCPLSQWGHPAISSSVVLFSSCLQSFPAWGSFLRSQFFPSGGQSIGVSVSASVLSMNIQDSFPLGLIGLISLLSKRPSRGFSKTTVQKHQFFGAQLS